MEVGKGRSQGVPATGRMWRVAHHRRHHAQRTPAIRTRRGAPSGGRTWAGFLCKAGFDTRLGRVRDLARFPELRWLYRFDWLPPTLFAAGLFALGEALPGTDGWQLLVWVT